MIIGIQMGITSGVAVYSDGKIIYAASEERFSRQKNDSGYPQKALEQAIKVCDIRAEEIEAVVMPSEKMTPVHMLCNIGGYGIDHYLKEQNEYYKGMLLEKNGGVRDYLEVFSDRAKDTPYKDLLEACKEVKASERSQVFNKWRIAKVCKDLGIEQNKVHILNHEYSHAAYGLYGSIIDDKENTCVVVYDGYGDDSNASIWIYEDNKLKQVSKYSNYNIGRVYRYVTLLLGMKPNEHEYKVMGLAPYASRYTYQKALDVFHDAYRIEEGKVIVNPDLKDNYFYFKDRLDGMRFDAIAGALQIFTEEMNKALIEYWLKKLGKRTLAISGGVSMNIKANMEIGKLEEVDKIFVTGSGGDESLCVGTVYAYLDSIGRSAEIEGLDNLYLGDDVLDVKEVLEEVDKTKYIVIESASNKQIAECLANGLVLGRVCGRMEFGARALGNRSVLADPRDRETVDRINKKIKSRDFWMPFTPSILAECANDYLDNPKGFAFPYMSIACETKDLARKELKAAIHPADKTARPQLVTQEMNYQYHDLISEFKKITGVGALLNTSLNIHGYPIVRTAKEAYYVLENTDLDGLIVDDNLILRLSRI